MNPIRPFFRISESTLLDVLEEYPFFSHATVGEEDGEIVIHTGLRFSRAPDGKMCITPFVPEE
jgi:hypothetical protein